MNEFLQHPGTFATGVNYWASHAATEMWAKWNAKSVEDDLIALKAQGVSVLRCFPLWPDFQPIRLLRMAGDPGGKPHEIRLGEAPLPNTPAGQAGVDEMMMRHFEEFCDLAEKHGLQLIVCLLTGHMTARQFVPPALEGLDAYTHPLALKWEVKFVKYFVTRMKASPAIAAWESGNESNFLSSASEPAAAWTWATLIHDAIRVCDDSRPIIGVSHLGLEETSYNKWLIRDQAELCDILSAHPYALWSDVYKRDEFNAIRNLHHAVSECRLVGDVGNKACFVEETGTWRPMMGSYEVVATALRNILWNLYQEDGRGLLWWCAFDQETIEVAPYDWTCMGLEHGILTSDREARPTATAIRDFSHFLEELPFERLPQHGHDAICLVNDMDVAFSSFVLARQAGIHLTFRHPAQPLEDADAYFLPVAAKRAGLSTGQWHELVERVREGATLYLSLHDTILDGFETTTGCGVISRKCTQDKARYDFGDFDVTLPRISRYEMTSYGGEILGKEDNGNPVFFRHDLEKGQVYTLAFPLERNVADTTDSFNTDAWRIYRRVLAPKRLIEKASPFLIATEHYFSPDKAAVILVNNQPGEIREELSINGDWCVKSSFSDVETAVVVDNTLTLQGNTGILLMLARRT